MRKSRKHPPRVYHDGLIPTAGDTAFQSYPEVVPDDHGPSKHEKSYPEVAPAPAPAPSPPPAHGTPPAQVPPPPAPTHALARALPRLSGVHSLREVWSQLDEPEDALPPEDRVPLWKRPIFWVVVISLAIIIALAGILGGVASGAIKTASNSSSSSSSTTTTNPQPAASIANPACPSANNLNYTSTASSSSSSSSQKTFRIQCDANHPGGDGALGLQNSATTTTTTTTLAGCLDACARHADCVGAVFRPATQGAAAAAAAQCWLKQFLGVVQTGRGGKGWESGVLWQ